MSIAGVAMLRTFHHRDFDLRRLLAHKEGRSVSVCLPARNEEATVGAIVQTVVRELVRGVPLVDEVVVVDDHSSDGTAAVAAAAGAHVVDAGDVLPDYGVGHGKGEALWKSLHATTGDLVLWCDADVEGFTPAFVTGLLGPLLTTPDVVFVKGFYDRPARPTPDGGSAGGGRVTELVARPVISLLFPELAPVVQPLSGEYGGRREVLEALPFVEGYGVDLALLIDVAHRHGVGAMAQVDLGVRRHRNRSLEELGPQALAVLHAALRRADPQRLAELDDLPELVRPGRLPVENAAGERPPAVAVPGYVRRSA